MSDQEYDVVVIGAGPGGYVCAIRCAQLGLRTALVEKDAHLGGTCLNVGCIPSKALLHSTELYHSALHGDRHGLEFDALRIDLARLMERKKAVVDQLRKGVQMLVKKRDIAVLKGTAAFVDRDTIEIHGDSGKPTRVQGSNFVIATGSMPASLPFLKPDGKQILTSTEALSLDEIPRSMAVIGAGAIGLEMGSVWSRLGTEVTFLEFLPTIAAGSDADVSRMAERIFKQQGMTFHTSTKVTAGKFKDDRVMVTAEKKGKELTLEVDKVLLSVGRQPNTGGLCLDAIGIETDRSGRIPVNQYKTSVDGIYAIGDVIDGPMLAHKAEEDGIAVAELLAGKPVHVDYERVPGVIYTDPEIAMIGMTETAAAEAEVEVKVGTFPLAANGRAIAQEATDGMAKIIADAHTDRILGASIIAKGASEMIAAIAAHMEYGGSAEDLAGTIHAHPTISESFKEAALAVDKRAIHSLPR